MELALIAAVSGGRVIGNKGEMPWHIKEDLKRFKGLTYGHPVLMGRKTYESIIKRNGKPLPARMNIVLSMDAGFQVNHPGATVCGNINEALEIASIRDRVCYVVGGQNVYEQTIGLANRLEITEVHGEFEGDAFFPEINKEDWTETFREKKDFYSFVTYRNR